MAEDKKSALDLWHKVAADYPDPADEEARVHQYLGLLRQHGHVTQREDFSGDS